MLNFSTFSVGGCWGQPMLLFWKLVDETQMVKPPEPTSHHNSRKYLILLPLRAIYFRSLHYETPCSINIISRGGPPYLFTMTWWFPGVGHPLKCNLMIFRGGPPYLCNMSWSPRQLKAGLIHKDFGKDWWLLPFSLGFSFIRLSGTMAEISNVCLKITRHFCLLGQYKCK